jgi:WD40 repeat protein
LVKVWEMATTVPVERSVLKGHTSPVVALAFVPDSQTLASAATDGHVILWRATDQVTAGEWHFPAAVNDLAVSPDGRYLAAATSKGAVYIVRLPAPVTQDQR